MNVATLSGIVGASYAMPDIHWGPAAPIGGVAATGDGVTVAASPLVGARHRQAPTRGEAATGRVSGARPWYPLVTAPGQGSADETFDGNGGAGGSAGS
ncbi:RtcB family protein [Streptomyces brasiliensis]|uniref:3'-phosphate/5'-hydroxy nucleic acid ligase n=1 Tax=Streptomyces brasiliensis TaxID=1954 RepID=A0A917P612_9ACTN|nr:RtcB family protein [Streptomyces brasiliensis]GGJ63506.1 hypothetical protein GCM10010121_087620 [Streptomyces brasiliensis]